MKYGYIKAGACTPEIKVADVAFNVDSIKKCMDKARFERVELLVFPELCITGYTCGDLFYQETLLGSALAGLKAIVDYSAGKSVFMFVGLPFKKDNLIYNVAAAVSGGKVLGLIPKTYLPNYNEFYEKRYFAPCPEENETISLFGYPVPFGRKIIFRERSQKNFTVAAEICEDLWAVAPPSTAHALAGANIIVNLSCSDETVGKAEYRRSLVKSHSARLVSAYVYADAGSGESTTDNVYAGHNLIAENGSVLAESKLFENGMTVGEIDLDYLSFDRAKLYNQQFATDGGYAFIEFASRNETTEPTRTFDKTPFVPADKNALEDRAKLILDMQAEGLKKRIAHTGAKTVVVGLSGGLDSTLAALVAVNAMKKLKRSPKDVIAVSMPCFGTTERTLKNASKLASSLGATFKKVKIEKAVARHLKDIKHEGALDVTYENAQARERTQVLMDIANMTGGIVVGTGDLSELALGWATYNGDHMSMYGVNASGPKTLVRHVVSYSAYHSRGRLKSVLEDVLDTPVSPELLPPENGVISQKTEDIVGPYELHDFFLYHFIRRGSSPRAILAAAVRSFAGVYDGATVLKWLKVFFKRFFAQQFKRSCLPDGVKVGTVALSPRGDWRMPSDAEAKLWSEELDSL